MQATIPLFSCSVQAGFPSPADDFLERKLDLNQHLVKHPAATFFLRVQGDSMRDDGILSDDILIVDRSIKPSHGKIVVAVLNGEFTVKRLWQKNGIIQLIAANPDYPAIEIEEGSELVIWGVVVSAIHQF